MSFDPEAYELVLASEQNRLMLQQQIEKDFHQMACVFPEDFTVKVYETEMVLNLIREKVIELMEQSEQKTLQLLYLIDLPEKQFLNLIRQADFIGDLSKRILEREMKKIYLRLKFS